MLDWAWSVWLVVSFHHATIGTGVGVPSTVGTAPGAFDWTSILNWWTQTALIALGPVRGIPSTVTLRPEGIVPIVIWYCRTKFAVIVVDPVHVIVWVWAPPSLHVSNRYCIPAPAAWGPGAEIIGWDESSHQNTY